MGLFKTKEKKAIAELCKKSEGLCKEISKEIDEHLTNLKSDYEENKTSIKEFNAFVNQLENKLSPQEIEKLQIFSSRMYKVKRCAKKGIEAMRELSRDQRKVTSETILEYQEYLHV